MKYYISVKCLCFMIIVIKKNNQENSNMPLSVLIYPGHTCLKRDLTNLKKTYNQVQLCSIQSPLKTEHFLLLCSFWAVACVSVLLCRQGRHESVSLYHLCLTSDCVSLCCLHKVVLCHCRGSQNSIILAYAKKQRHHHILWMSVIHLTHTSPLTFIN